MLLPVLPEKPKRKLCIFSFLFLIFDTVWMCGASPRNKFSVDSDIPYSASYHLKKILQWGIHSMLENAPSPQMITLPMSYSTKHIGTVISNHTDSQSFDIDSAGYYVVCTVIGSLSLNGFSTSFVRTPGRIISFLSVGR